MEKQTKSGMQSSGGENRKPDLDEAILIFFSENIDDEGRQFIEKVICKQLRGGKGSSFAWGKKARKNPPPLSVSFWFVSCV